MVRGILSRFEPCLRSLWSVYETANKSPIMPIPCGRHTYGPLPEILGNPRFAVGSRIGNFCSIGPGVKFLFLGKHAYEWATTYPFYEFYGYWRTDTKCWKGGAPDYSGITPEPIIVGNDVWIAANARIKQGITVGNGAVIAMDSLVVSDVPPYAMVGGNPARIIRYRFPESQIEELLNIAWWNWDDARIKEMLPLLLSNDVAGFISAVRSKATH